MDSTEVELSQACALTQGVPALKARNSLAQGAALGFSKKPNQALKGRHRLRLSTQDFQRQISSVDFFSRQWYKTLRFIDAAHE
jgi:hypothetical protein